MDTAWQIALDGQIERLFPQIVELRRHLHAHPEPSGEEFNTSLLLYQRLGNLGLDVRMGGEGRGVIVDLPAATAAGDAPLVAMRADIDALRIQDAKQVAYRSTCPNVMHACGHDAHTAVVFGAVHALVELQSRGELPWPVRWRAVFQPAEETSQGAREMIAAGALEGVSLILANHMDPSRSVGRVGLRAGPLTASCDDLRIRVNGRGGHAARPHETRDPIAAAAQLISALYQFVPRSTDSQDAVVVTIGQIIAGDNPNVIPERVELHGTLRTLHRDVRKNAMDRVREIGHGIGQTSGTQIDVQFYNGSPPVDNDAGVVDIFRRAATDALGAEGVEAIPRPSMGAEDFAFYLEHVPGAMARIGCKSASVGGQPLHAADFDIDEAALAVAMRVLVRTVIMASDPARRAGS
ncbi:MAG: amidohydrolase [Planctomycetales bacterium]|nr:amidohydrolase [Planctomycetales bacterium]